MVKAIDNIKAWAKENVQLITILPENTTLIVDTRLKDVLETSVDEKYYLSDEKTALLIERLEEKDKVIGTVGHHPFSKKFEFSGFNSEVSPTLLATDYKAPKTVLEQGGVEYSRKTGIGKQLEVAHCLSASDWRGLNRNQSQTAVAEVKQLGNVNPSGRGMNGSVYDINAGLSPTLTTNKGEGQRITEAPYYRIRKLTPLECFRLQSFPDWTYHEAAEVNSNSQLYRQAGNSVTVNVIHEIAKHLN